MREVSDCLTCKKFFECIHRGIKHGCINYEENDNAEEQE